MSDIRIFIGYDPRQPISYNVLQHSIVIRSTKPVAITPLIIQQLPIKRVGLTPFTWTRFLVPHLCGYEGWGLFLDADMIVLDDIDKLFAMADYRYAVMSVLGAAKFEHASLMLFNCSHEDNRKLTPEYIENAPALHGLQWTQAIGDLPKEWNHIVFYDEPRRDAKLVHYTAGVPVFKEVEGCEYSEEWGKDARFMASAQSWQQLMGNSVHVAKIQEFQKKRKANGRSLILG